MAWSERSVCWRVVEVQLSIWDEIQAYLLRLFPAGRKVRPAVAFVDLHASIQVEEVREAMDRDGQVYAAVRFTTTNGTVVWTNVRRGKHFWMKSV